MLARKWPKSAIEQAIHTTVPTAVGKRLDQLVSRRIAAILWKSRGFYKISADAKADFKYLQDYLAVPSNPWAVSIGHLIPRDHYGESFGDASTEAGCGFMSHTHHFWCALSWSQETARRIHLLNHTHQIHINQLEMVTYLLQLVAVCVAINEPNQFGPAIANLWSNAPTAPQWLVHVDNMTAKSWGEKNMARSLKGQLLLRFQAALYHRYDVNGRTQWISTHNNGLADMLSQGLISPLTPASYTAFVEQVFLFDKRLKTYAIFTQVKILYPSHAQCYATTREWDS